MHPQLIYTTDKDNISHQVRTLAVRSLLSGSKCMDPCLRPLATSPPWLRCPSPPSHTTQTTSTPGLEYYRNQAMRLGASGEITNRDPTLFPSDPSRRNIAFPSVCQGASSVCGTCRGQI